MKSLIHNSIEEVPGDDVQLVGRSQGSLELLPLLLTAKDAWKYTFEKKESLLVCEKSACERERERESIITCLKVQLSSQM